eukprot:13184551-Heterocapsa_arctica.AAC.1
MCPAVEASNVGSPRSSYALCEPVGVVSGDYFQDAGAIPRVQIAARRPDLRTMLIDPTGTAPEVAEMLRVSQPSV